MSLVFNHHLLPPELEGLIQATGVNICINRMPCHLGVIDSLIRHMSFCCHGN